MIPTAHDPIPIDPVRAAARVWSLRRVISVHRHVFGYEVNLRTPRRGDGVLASDTRDRWLAAHSLDHAGRVTCHDDCKALAGELATS